MATATYPRLSSKQADVLATLPEQSGRLKPSYEKLAKVGLVRFGAEGPFRTDDGDDVLAHLRAEGIVPEAEEVELPEVEQPEVEPEAEQAAPVEAPKAPKPKAARKAKNPAKPGPGLTRTCKYRDHQGQNPLPFEDDTNFPLRAVSFEVDPETGEETDVETPRSGTAVGWCRHCQSLYRRTKTRESFVPLAEGGDSLPTTVLGGGEISGIERDLLALAEDKAARNERIRQAIADAARPTF